MKPFKKKVKKHQPEHRNDDQQVAENGGEDDAAQDDNLQHQNENVEPVVVEKGLRRDDAQRG